MRELTKKEQEYFDSLHELEKLCYDPPLQSLIEQFKEIYSMVIDEFIVHDGNPSLKPISKDKCVK